jgi:phosphonate transport system substrate-binding protein
MRHSFTLGAVAYDPKVVTIWEGFKEWFALHDFGFDFVLYSNYEAQVEAHLAGAMDAAWNSPLAAVRTRRLAASTGRRAREIVMRDTDQDLTSVVVVRSDSAIHEVAQLASATVATGALDSPQATLLPLAHLAGQGLDPAQFTTNRFDVMVGKHGDHVGGEREAVKSLIAGESDAACMIDSNQLLFAHDGTIAPGSVRVLTRTEPYDHCTMTVLDGVDDATVDRFIALLLSMSYDDPDVRPLLQLEGLKEWRPGRTSGHEQLAAAVDRLRFYAADGSILAEPHSA